MDSAGVRISNGFWLQARGKMKRATRKKVYSPPAMEMVTYEQAREKIEAEQQHATSSSAFPVILLQALLMAFPVLVLLSAVDPSGFLQHRVVRAVSPLVWNAWALICLWASLSAESLVKKLARKTPLRGGSLTYFFLMGLINCISLVVLLWLVGRSG
jgi:uncharacterized membrane protein (DUF4010 family)